MKTNKLREEFDRLYPHVSTVEDVKAQRDMWEWILDLKSQWKQEALKAMPEEKDITELVERSDLHKKYKDQLSYDLGDNQGYNQAVRDCKKTITDL